MNVDELLEAQIETLRAHHGWEGIALFRLENPTDDAIGNIIVKSGDDNADSFARKIAGAVMPATWPAIVAAATVSGVTREVLAAELRQAYKARSKEGFYCWPNLTPDEQEPWIAAADRCLSLIERLREEVRDLVSFHEAKREFEEKGISGHPTL